MGFSIQHLLVLLVIVVLVFGTKKLRNLGQDLGGAIKGFKDGMKQNSESEEKTATNENNLPASEQIKQQQVNNTQTIDVEVKKEEHKV